MKKHLTYKTIKKRLDTLIEKKNFQFLKISETEIKNTPLKIEEIKSFSLNLSNLIAPYIEKLQRIYIQKSFKIKNKKIQEFIIIKLKCSNINLSLLTIIFLYKYVFKNELISETIFKMRLSENFFSSYSIDFQKIKYIKTIIISHKR